MTPAMHMFQGCFARVAVMRRPDLEPTPLQGRAQVLLALDGPGLECRTPAETGRLDDETYLAIDPWTPVLWEVSAERTPILALSFEPAWVGRSPTALLAAGSDMLFSELAHPMGAAVRAARDRVIRALSDHRQRLEAGDDGAEADLALEGLVDALFRAAAEPALGSGAEPPFGVRALDPRIRRSVRLMRGAVGKEPGVDAIAVAAGLSRSRFFEQFRECCGLTPRAYADALLVEEAARRLSDGVDPIAAISRTLGFSAQSHFTRFFRNRTGMTPSAYRQAARLRLQHLERAWEALHAQE
ncbi:MAG: AraC family transcriptional regulator [Alphaproteobacteria bacterium]|nr:AraC family transcriptional regulator [Alphaproteobacteria bacterium]